MVSAKDADIGPNGDIRYSLYGPGNNEFFLDPESGKTKFILWNYIVNPQEKLSFHLVLSLGGSWYLRALMWHSVILDS